MHASRKIRGIYFEVIEETHRGIKATITSNLHKIKVPELRPITTI